MGRVRHKRKNSKVLIVTSDAVDARVRQYRIRPQFFRVISFVLCVIVGVLLGVGIFEKDIWLESFKQSSAQQDVIRAMGQEKAELEKQISGLNDEIAGLNAEIAELNEQILILSRTVALKTENENRLSQEIEKQSLPTKFPLTGAANMEEASEGDPMCIFTAASGSMVVATAKGTVIVVNDDPEYGHNVWVDHGNGYVTVYRNKGDVKVKQGETVSQGTTLFLIDSDNNKLGYQMMKDGVYINPMDMLTISG